MNDLTPAQIVAELDKYIVGQRDAKRAVAIALRNRYRRRLLDDELRDDVIPKNILMIGPTGVGKTEIARRLAKLARAPFVKVEATKFTEVGYVGRDVDSMVRDLVQVSMRLVEAEKIEEVQKVAEDRAVDRIVEMMLPSEVKRKRDPEPDSAEQFRQVFGGFFGGRTVPSSEAIPQEDEESSRKRAETESQERRILKERITAGLADDDLIEVEVEQTPPSFMQVFSGQGMDEMNMGDLQSAFSGMMNRNNKKQRKVTVKEARVILTQEEARAMIDQDAVTREALERAEQSGIIFIDEMDKIAGRGGGSGPDVSREGVQRDLLPIIEGSTVTTKYGPVRTNHVLFIAAGAFHVSKPSDLIPELQGRLPIRVELESLTESDFQRILTEPKTSITRQYVALLATEGVQIHFTPDAIEAISGIAATINQQSENIGARRLHTVMERLLEEISFEAPEIEAKHINIDAAFVHSKLDSVAKNEDLSRYIL